MRKPTLSQRLKAKNRRQALVVGVTWYNETSWAQVKATATDPECFEDSFDKWKAAAVAARREFQRSGIVALECQVEPQDFADWCTHHQLPNNASSRAEYVSQKLTAAYQAR